MSYRGCVFEDAVEACKVEYIEGRVSLRQRELVLEGAVQLEAGREEKKEGGQRNGEANLAAECSRRVSALRLRQAARREGREGQEGMLDSWHKTEGE